MLLNKTNVLITDFSNKWDELSSNLTCAPFAKQKKISVGVIVSTLAIPIISRTFFPLPTIVHHISLILGLASIGLLATLCKVSVGNSKKFAQQREGANINGQKIILILNAEYDHNQAFDLDNSASLSILRNQKDYQVICKTVKTVKEICQTINTQVKQNNQIIGLWIRAHGSPNAFVLSSEGDKLSNKMSEITKLSLKTSFSKLPDDSTIILHSCSTGKQADDHSISIAQTISELAPQATVYAPIDEFCGLGLIIENLSPLKVRFYKPYGSDRSFFQRVRKMFSAFLITWIDPSYGENITAIFKAYHNLQGV